MTGVVASGISIDNGSGYYVTGNPITLGSGGISAATAGFTSTLWYPAISLSADQTWSFDRGTLDLESAVTGVADTLGIALSHSAILGMSGDNELGAVTITGGSNIADRVIFYSGGSLNGADGNSVSLTHVNLSTIFNLSLGSLTLTGSDMWLLGTSGGMPQTPIVSVNGAASLDGSSRLDLSVVPNGSVPSPGSNYSQLSASGNVTVGGDLVLQDFASACPALTVGDVYTFVQTTGAGTSLSGTFSNAPEGAAIPLYCNGIQGTIQIHYTSTSVTGTVVAQHTLLVSLAGSGSGSVSGGGVSCPGTCSVQVADGSQITLTATPASGSVFAGWSGGGCSGTGSCSLTVTSTTLVNATFDLQAPVNLAPPTISGSLTEGQTLNEGRGSWAYNPTSYAQQWERCDNAGANCTPIPGASGQAYGLTSGDVGARIRVQEWAINAAGTGGPASSPPTGVIKSAAALLPIRPQVSLPPVISGAATVRQTLSSSQGAWSGTAPMTFAYQWQRCNPACVNIRGATGATYELNQADVGFWLQVIITATNRAGSGQAASSPVGPVAPAAPTIKALLTKSLAPKGKAAKIGALLKGSYSVSLITLSGGRITIDWYYLPKGARLTKANPKPKPRLIASGTARFLKPGRIKLTIKLTKTGKQMLRPAKALKLTAKGTYTPTGARAVTTVVAFTLKR